MSSGGLGGGGFFGRAGNEWGPRGQYGCWPSCGCGALVMILGAILLVCGGCLSVVESGLRF